MRAPLVLQHGRLDQTGWLLGDVTGDRRALGRHVRSDVYIDVGDEAGAPQRVAPQHGLPERRHQLHRLRHHPVVAVVLGRRMGDEQVRRLVTDGPAQGLVQCRVDHQPAIWEAQEHRLDAQRRGRAPGLILAPRSQRRARRLQPGTGVAGGHDDQADRGPHLPPGAQAAPEADLGIVRVGHDGRHAQVIHRLLLLLCAHGAHRRATRSSRAGSRVRSGQVRVRSRIAHSGSQAHPQEHHAAAMACTSPTSIGSPHAGRRNSTTIAAVQVKVPPPSASPVIGW